jgi:hypothetical protein
MHQRIYERLKEVARAKELTTYKEIAEMVGLDWRKNYGKCRQIFPILGAISTSEVQQGHPMLSAVAVRQDKRIPGLGFFTLARDLGVYSGDNDLAFWNRELNEVHNYWQSQQSSAEASLGILKDKGFTFEDFLKERQQERQKESERESKDI